MWKKFVRNGLLGISVGIALNTVLAIAVSYWLQLGYLMPYPAALPEYVGGEINAALLTMVVCGLLGMGFGFAITWLRVKQIKPLVRNAAATLSLGAAALPVFVLALQVIK